MSWWYGTVGHSRWISDAVTPQQKAIFGRMDLMDARRWEDYFSLSLGGS